MSGPSKDATDPSNAVPGTAPTPPSTSEQPKRYFQPSASEPPANEFTEAAIPKVADAIKLTSWDRIKELPQKPCVRESFLNGMGAGFAIGGVRFVVGSANWKPALWKAYGWAIWSFVGVSLASREFCLRKRMIEKHFADRASEIIKVKAKEKEEKALARKEEMTRKKQEEQERLERENAKRWYKFW